MIEKVEFQEEKVSSTALRKLIRNGEMEQIPSILGRAYTVRNSYTRRQTWASNWFPDS